MRNSNRDALALMQKINEKGIVSATAAYASPVRHALHSHPLPDTSVALAEHIDPSHNKFYYND